MDVFSSIIGILAWAWQYLIPFLVVIGILVFIHEFGHFSFAKLFGIRVDVFSFGFGPRLVGFRRKETDYRISAVPWGGYVKIAGETPEDSTGALDELQSKPIYARFMIFFAGPALNLLLTVIILPIVYMIGIQVPAWLDEEPVIGWIDKNSPAERHGIQIGDRILSVNDESLETIEETLYAINLKPNQDITLTLQRNDETLSIPVTLEEDPVTNLGYLGIDWEQEAIIGGLNDGYPAQKGGMLPDDKIIRINDTPIDHWNAMHGIISSHPDQELKFTVQRGEETIVIPVVPEPTKFGDETVGRIGIFPKQKSVFKKYDFIPAIKKGLDQTWDFFTLITDTIRKLIFGEISPKTLAGPLVIGKITGEMAQAGISKLLWWMALFSFNLGILNLLPIPILDGGHIMFLLGELILRKPVNMRVREITTQIGFVLIIMLTFYVLFNDVIRIFPDLDLGALFSRE
jgi:regulator of sigma E protease